MIYLIFGLIFALITYLIVDYFNSIRLDRMRERLMAGVYDENEEEISIWKDASDILRLAELKAVLEKSPIIRILNTKLKRSGLQISLTKLFFIMILTPFAIAIALQFFFHQTLISLGGLIGGFLLAVVLLNFLEASNISLLDKQLPSFIANMINTLSSGGTPMQALLIVSKNAPKPLGPSIGDLLYKLQIGVAPNLAWKEWADYWGSASTKLVATGIRLKWETGGQMSLILKHINDSLDFHKRMDLRISTLTAQAKLSAWVLSALPALLALLTNAYRPDLFEVMLSDPLGKKLLSASAVMSVLGFLWLRKIAKLKT